MVRRANTGWIGVDLGTATVTVAQVVRDHHRLCLAASALVPRRQPWAAEQLADAPPLPSRDEIAAALSLIGAAAGRPAAATLSMAVCDARMLQIPAERAELDARTVAAVLTADAAISSAPRVFDFWSTAAGTARQEHEVATVSVAEAWSDRCVDDLERAGTRCCLLDGNPWAVARAVELTAERATEGCVAAVDWGYGGATFCSVRAGRPVYVRKLRKCPLSKVLGHVQTELATSPEETDRMLRTWGVAGLPTRSDTCELLAELLAEPLDQLANELRRTLDYLRSHQASAMPSRLVLLGGGAAIRGVAAVLENRLGLPVTVWQADPDLLDVGARDPLRLPPVATAIALSVLRWKPR